MPSASPIKIIEKVERNTFGDSPEYSHGPIKSKDIDTIARPTHIFSFFEVSAKYFCDMVTEIG